MSRYFLIFSCIESPPSIQTVQTLQKIQTTQTALTIQTLQTIQTTQKQRASSVTWHSSLPFGILASIEARRRGARTKPFFAARVFHSPLAVDSWQSTVKEPKLDDSQEPEERLGLLGL
jgi:hypothetical protein